MPAVNRKSLPDSLNTILIKELVRTQNREAQHLCLRCQQTIKRIAMVKGQHPRSHRVSQRNRKLNKSRVGNHQL